MANVKVFQKRVKGHSQGHMFKMNGFVGKGLVIRYTHAKYESPISYNKTVLAKR